MTNRNEHMTRKSGTYTRYQVFPTLLFLILFALPLHSFAVEYNWINGPLNQTESWENAEGAHPESFELDGQLFTVSNPQSEDDIITTDGNWTVAGEGTTLIINTDNDIIFVENATVVFDAITIEFTENAGGDLVAKGDIAVTNGVSWDYDDAGDVWRFDYREDGEQALMSDGTAYLLVYNFRSQKDDGAFDLISLHPDDEEVIVLRTLNNFRTRYREEALFSDRGNWIVIGDDVRIIGEHDSYLFTGTIEHRVDDGNSDYEEVEADLNNLIIIARNDGNPRFRNNEDYTQNITIKGDFFVDMYTEGDIKFNDVRLEVHGNVRMSHTRPAGTDGDSEIDLDESELIVGGDFTLVLSKDEEDGDENIDVDNANITVGGNVYVYAENNGEFDLDDGLIRVMDGHAEFYATNNGIIDFDNGTLIVYGDITVSVDGHSELDLDDSHIHLTGSLDIFLEPGAEVDYDEFVVRYFGSADQVVSSLGGTNYYVLEIIKEEGHVILEHNLSVMDRLSISLENDATFSDQGHMIQILNQISLQGSGLLYTFDGAIVLAERTVESQNKKGASTLPATTNDDDGILTFDYKQLGLNDVTFYLYMDEILEDSLPEPVATFALENRDQTDVTEIFFDEENPVITFMQDQVSGSGPVEITNLKWYLPGDERPVEETTDLVPEPDMPIAVQLNQNYPNPFNPSTVIGFQVPESSHVTLRVYDLNGRLVATLVNENKTAGSYEITWDAGTLASGVYLYKLQAESHIQTKQMMLIK